MATFNCVSCEEDITGFPVVVVQDSVCEECFEGGIVPLFHSALANELEYPVLYRGVELPIDPYVNTHSSQDFVRSWFEKTVERRLLPRDRLFCAGPGIDGDRCNHFLGKKADHDPTEPCSKCTSLTCANCDAQITSVSHICGETQETDSFATQNQTRGVDYQLCPNCQTPINLRDGCNHITCPPPCNTHFCYVCGLRAHPDDRPRHWSINGCPLYNRAHLPAGLPVIDPPPRVDTRPGLYVPPGALENPSTRVNRLFEADRDHPFERYWLLRGMGTLVHRRVREFPWIQVAENPRTAAAAVVLDVIPILQSVVLRSPEGRVMNMHMASISRLCELAVRLMFRDAAGPGPPRFETVHALAILLDDSQRIYVRHRINMFGWSAGEEFWELDNRLLAKIEQVEEVASHVTPEMFALFPELVSVLAGWRLAARRDFAALRALAPPAAAPEALPRPQIIFGAF